MLSDTPFPVLTLSWPLWPLPEALQALPAPPEQVKSSLPASCPSSLASGASQGPCGAQGSVHVEGKMTGNKTRVLIPLNVFQGPGAHVAFTQQLPESACR